MVERQLNSYLIFEHRLVIGLDFGFKGIFDILSTPISKHEVGS